MKQAQWYSRRETYVLEFSHNPQPISTENTENLLRIKWQFRLNSKLSALTLMTIINYLAGTSHAPFFTFTPSFKIIPPPPCGPCPTGTNDAYLYFCLYTTRTTINPAPSFDKIIKPKMVS